MAIPDDPMVTDSTVLPLTDSAHPFAPEHTVAIYNPVSGNAIGKTRARRLIQKLTQRGFRVEWSENVGHLSSTAMDAVRDGMTSAIIIGGDGTLYEVLGRLPSRVNIAYFPGGTANLFALNWHIPRMPDAWMNLLESGRTQNVRLGLCNTRPFASVASVGFDALIVHRMRYPLKRLLSNGAYALEFIPSYFAYNAPKFKVTVDGARYPDDVLGIIVGRGCYYGGPFRILPEPDPHAPLLSYAILNGKSKWELGKYAVGMLFETLSRMHGVSCGMAREITVETDPPTYVQLDGDAYGGTPVLFTAEACDRTILA